MTDYEIFEQEKIQCKQCIIGSFYNKVVCSDGNKKDPIIVILGEAPGDSEVIGNQPFIGKAGQVLREQLRKFGYNKKNTLITNTIPCRPLDNKYPTDKSLIDNCTKKWLFRELDILKPKYLILLGAKPLSCILGLEGITRLRGNFYDYELNGNKMKCYPICHPSYVMRKQYMEEGKKISEDFVNDLRNVSKEAGII